MAWICRPLHYAGFLLLLLLVLCSARLGNGGTAAKGEEGGGGGGGEAKDEGVGEGRVGGGEGDKVVPHVFVSILARNVAHVLPNFFGYLENQNYPKNRISIWVRSDHNIDTTSSVLEEWCSIASTHYHTVDCYTSSEWIYPTNSTPFSMPEERYLNVATLRQSALDTARSMGADYLLSIDTDCFLVNPNTLQLLIDQNKTIVGPMLTAPAAQAYSNFWMDQDSTGYYKRHEDYFPTLQRNRTGCLPVPVVLATFLIHLSSSSSSLVYHPPPSDFTGPVDDVVQLAFSAKKEGLGMYILNTEFFGIILKPDTYPSLEEAANAFLYLKLKSLVDHPPVLYSQYLPKVERPKSNLGLDAVYTIGLARRPDRRNRMLACLDELDFDYTVFDAVDGRILNASYVEDELGVRYMPNWRDPWGNRTMTLGEVGCFLSHLTIWKEVISTRMERVLILEDDIDFEVDFKKALVAVMAEAEEVTPSWDLIYVGRKRLHFESEQKVPGASYLISPHYSYWTLGYLLSNRGARKLMEAEPFQNFLPVDEFFPILFGQHPREDWAKHYLNQTLEVYSADPLLVHPTYYVGDSGWYSDTEPPPEVLAQIRKRKREEEKQYLEELRKKKEQEKEKVKSKAVQRQLERMRSKITPKSEL